MPTVRVHQPHNLGRDAAMPRLQSFEQMLQKYRVKLEWKGHRADIKGVGVGGEVLVSDADVTVTIELGLIARAAGVDADRLRASIARRLAEALAPSQAG